ncbi:MAG TPA: tetratricopeptide repeat protein [Planctomycetes bacterium]|nr:tetratricopeptide repeat protein [Planctomycetota bacterium]
MNSYDPTIVEALRSHVSGTGLQCFPGVSAPLQGVTNQDSPSLGEVADASLDYVVAGGDFLGDGNATTRLLEWRRTLKEGGTLAVLLPSESAHHDLVVRYLVQTAGIRLESKTDLPGGLRLLVGQRNFYQAWRRGIADVGREVGRLDKPDGWKQEVAFGIGTLLLETAEGEGACQFFEAVLRHDPTSVDAWIGLGIANVVAGRPDVARQHFATVLAAEPENALAQEWTQRLGAKADTQVPAGAPA